ncbi:DUF2142 domain-containing protein [Pyxidicoccus xibeiensis]|uniref:DUF2142 domain-containing protein n=1 Tax=Pyxidicoccus xibeiensis TaxID=2906759 RepID=UPI0020A82E40|nr:DUF2142 domain-containing protein [Pyxidicoccus xibeiensis]MCP3138245.1 DUF2142 domain-containing protein [Pyxidicoccus xibeiensis]
MLPSPLPSSSPALPSAPPAPLPPPAARSSARAPVLFFVAVASLVGLVTTFLTPPFQVPDEPVHYYRAFHISEGHLVAEKVGNDAESVGGMLPRSMIETVDITMRDIPFNAHVKVDRERMRKALDLPLAPGDRVPYGFAAASVYFPLVYFPQALGMLPARLFEPAPVVLLWAGRLGNLLASVVLIALALRLLPFHRWTFALLALTPMVLFQRTSVSGDPLTFSACVLLMAVAFHLTFVHRERLRPAQLGLLLGCAVFVALCKQAYLPLTLLFLLLPVARLGSLRRYAMALAVVVAVPTLLQLAWSATAKAAYRPGAVSAQIAFVLQNPFKVLGYLVTSFWADLPRLSRESIGKFGWLDTPLPDAGLVALVILVLAVALLDGPTEERVGWRVRLLSLAIALGGFLLVHAMLYVAWTPVAAEQVQGVQGRYLLPFFPLLVVAIAPSLRMSRTPAWLKPALAVVFGGLSVGLTLTVLYQRYYGAV